MLNFRAPETLTAAVDAWVEQQADPKPSRSEAIRQLIEAGLAAQEKAERA